MGTPLLQLTFKASRVNSAVMHCAHSSVYNSNSYHVRKSDVNDCPQDLQLAQGQQVLDSSSLKLDKTSSISSYILHKTDKLSR